jgi:TRAP transporter TAXI family solute receptor
MFHLDYATTVPIFARTFVGKQKKEVISLKKTLAILMAAALLLALAGCGSSSAAPAASAGKVDADYIYATGGTGGTYYPLGGAISGIINKYTGSNITVNSTGASVENCRLISSGDADMGFSQSDVTFYALEGINAFKDTGKLTGLKTVAAIFPEVIHIITTDPSINSPADLKGKRFSVGAAGSGNEVVSRLILEAYGMTYDDVDERFLTDAEGRDGVQDGTIDAYLTCTGVPSPSVTELSIAKKIKALSIDKATRDKIISENRFFSNSIIPKDAYKTDADAETLAVTCLLVCNADLPEEHVYLMTKAIFENQPELQQAHAKGAHVSLEKAMDGVTPGNVHPGAAKYFAEKGITVP